MRFGTRALAATVAVIGVLLLYPPRLRLFRSFQSSRSEGVFIDPIGLWAALHPNPVQTVIDVPEQLYTIEAESEAAVS